MSIRFVQSWHKMTQKVITKIKKKDEEDELLGADHPHHHPPHHHHSSSGGSEGGKRNIFHEVRKRNKKSKTPKKKDEQKVDATDSPGTSAYDSSAACEIENEIDLTDIDISHVSDNGSHNLSSDNDHVENGHCTDAKAEKDQFPQAAPDESSKSSSSSILSALLGWLEIVKAFFIAVSQTIRRTCGKTCLKLLQTCRFGSKCFLKLGKILLLATMVWLDCLFRGVNSSVRMGTTSFFSVLWFSVFSVIAIIGIVKFLLVLGITVLIGALLGFVISLLIMALIGGFCLWVYGSFWTTFVIILSAGVAFTLSCQRLALLITTVYSAYCAGIYVGWPGVVLGFNLSFITSDAFAYFLKHKVGHEKNEHTDGIHVEPRFFSSESQFSYSEQAGLSGGVTCTSDANSEITSHSEVIRLFNCTDHYSALGFLRYQRVDASVLKKEYRKKARLVHPDKNMGNEKAAQAFMRLQGAYEVLLDPAKQKAYDEELKKEETQKYFSRFRCVSEKKGKDSSVPGGSAQSEGKGEGEGEGEGEETVEECRKIACKKCGGSHMWFPTKKPISKARWCQDCLDFHKSKDGDGWVEQSSQGLLFGMLQKVDAPVAYVCADDKVYDASEWFICQGMRCPPNTHKPTFQVNTSTKNNNKKGAHRRTPTFSLGGSMTDEEFFSWLHNTMQSGVLESISSFGGGGTTSYDTNEQTSPKTASKNAPNTDANSGTQSQNKRKRGRKFW